ncbi:PRC-barrel domain-containing protein [Methylobacterium pseudosasicola]|uniref:PRC-barrel domain-containing protein n=1 Tax=Methylobacterium pseudosasicola TaxID=582667 RepID=A0A1I4KDP7_9HYPH|nr:PRC-barrel domain-containing protein [Methylobacterium pseudosasicola]SFL76850.1 PRC-barrel domain-containing protein [Methylobacterium pseudosasicola]
MRTALLLLPLALIALAESPAGAQDASVVGNKTVLPGTGPGTTTGGSDGGRLMAATSAAAAAKRQDLKPVAFLASTMIGVAVRNAAGDKVGTVDDLLIAEGGSVKAVVLDVGGLLGSKRIAVEPGALVLRPGGDRFSAVLNMSTDTVAAAQPFDPAKAMAAD